MPKPETLGHQHVRWMQLGTTRLDTLQGVNKSVIESAIRRAWGIPKWKNILRSNLPPQLILTLYKIPTVKSGLNGYPKWVFLKYPKYCLEVLSPSGVSRSIYVSYQGEQSVRRDKMKEQRLYKALQSLGINMETGGQENRASRNWLKAWLLDSRTLSVTFFHTPLSHTAP